MQRACDFCGETYEAKRSTSRFCGSSCRGRNSATGGEAAPVTEISKPTERGEGGVTAATRKALASAGRVDSPLGQVALALAHRLDNGHMDTGSALASVAKQHAATLSEATAGAKVEADPLDELREIRERKRSAAG